MLDSEWDVWNAGGFWIGLSLKTERDAMKPIFGLISDSIRKDRTMKYLATAVIVLTAIVYSNMAFAWDTGRPYIKTSIGKINYDGSTSGQISSSRLLEINYEIDDESFDLDIGMGFPINDYLTVELGFFYLTESDWSLEVNRQVYSGKFKAYGVTPTTSFRLPINNKIGILGKIGYYLWEIEVTENRSELSVEDTGYDLLAGVGVDFRVHDSVAFVLGYDYYSDAGRNTYIGMRISPW